VYNTHLLERVGLFQIKDSCKSIDVSKDSKLLFATAVTKGVKIFDVSNGEELSMIEIPGIQIKQVELSYSDKFFVVLYEDRNRESFIRIYSVKDALEWGKLNKAGSPECVKEIKGPKDHDINYVKWGALDKTIYYCTSRGRLLRYDVEESQVIDAKDVHRHEIFTITITRDFTMLFTCSRDGTCKLLNPETLDEIRSYEFTFPCRNATISPLYDAEDNQKFHVLLCGGQDAKDVTTTGA
jgi:translation initiation factor 3 subunit I